MSFTLHPGTTPLLVSVPHAGTAIPEDQRHRYTARALGSEDTDWFVERLWDFATGMGAGLLVPAESRYLVDLNRPVGGAPMYPGANNTELCPTRHFSGEPLYRDGLAPDAAEVARRVERYWRPYHEVLAGELARLRTLHGHAVLLDAHSIRGELPWLFEGRLPDLNLGSAGGASCAPALRQGLAAVLAAEPRWTHVVDGRFRGGHITRHYGRPAEGLHAVQLEMAWRAYMDEAAPPRWDEARARAITPLLARLVATLRDWRPS
jgi:N-formylglutamate deformylase